MYRQSATDFCLSDLIKIAHVDFKLRHCRLRGERNFIVYLNSGSLPKALIVTVHLALVTPDRSIYATDKMEINFFFSTGARRDTKLSITLFALLTLLESPKSSTFTPKYWTLFLKNCKVGALEKKFHSSSCHAHIR